MLRTTAALALLSCLWLAAGCADRRAQADVDHAEVPVRGGTLEIVGYSDVDHMATTSAYVTYSLWLTRLFARQLLAYEPGPDLGVGVPAVPDLAAEVPTRENGGISADGLTYVFHLKPGIRWDSDPPRDVTAQDFVRAFALFCNPVMPVGAAGYYIETIAGMAEYCADFARVPGTVEAIREFVTTHSIVGVQALDDATVRFTLRAPTPDFPNLVAMPFASPVPVEYLDYLPDGPEFRQHVLSTGPYRIARYLQNRELVFERNPIWDPATDPLRPAWVDRVVVRMGIDAQLQQLQIEAGTADMGFETVRSADLAPLLAIDDPTLWLAPSGDFYALMDYLGFNRIGPNDALGSRDVRRAVVLAVDRAALVQVTGGPRANRPLRQAVLSTASGYDPHAEDATRGGPGAADHGDPDAARALLAKAGYPDGVRLRLAFQTSSSYPLIAQVLQASLARAGFDVELVPVTTSDFYARLLADPDNATRGEWDLVLGGWLPDWYGQNGRSVIMPLFDGRHLEKNTQNYGHYQNHDVDAAIDRATVAPSAELSEQAWREAARLLIEDAALAPLIERKLAYAKSRRVRGCVWSVLGLNCDLTSVWLSDAAARRP